jgi:uncharacterized protein YegP (UPF0339 family)
MKEHYDFSKAKRGLFYIGNEPFDIVIHVDGSELASHPRFEIFSDAESAFRFRLLDDSHIVFTSDIFPSKDACLNAVAELKQTSMIASTVFA